MKEREMKMMNRCACGNRMSKYSNVCNVCHERKMNELKDRIRSANDILAKGTVILRTAFGPYILKAVTQDLWGSCYPQGQMPSNWNQRSFCLHGGHVSMVLEGKTEL